MKPIEFKGQNIIIAKHQEQYQNLPALRLAGREGKIYTCWELSFFERLAVLFTGRVWHVGLTFNGPVQPMRIEAAEPERVKFQRLTDNQNKKSATYTL